MHQSTIPEGPAQPHSADIRLYLIPSLLLAFFLATVTLVSIAQPRGLLLTHSALLNVTITSAALVIALGVAYFSVTEFLLYGLASAALVGLAFLLMAESDLLNGLLPLLIGRHPGTITPATTWSSGLAWSFTRSAAGALLLAAGLNYRRLIAAKERVEWIATGVVLVLLVALAASIAIDLRSPHQPRDVLLVCNAAGVVLYFAASVLFWQAARATGRTWFIWLALSLGIGTFSELQFMIFPFRSTVVQPGDVLRLAFSAGILLALIGEWGRGFRALRSQTRELEVLHALMTAPEIRDLGEVVDHAARVIGEAMSCDAHLLLPGRHQTADTAIFALLAQANIPEDPNVVVAFDEGVGGRAGLVTGLEVEGRRLGTLAVSRPRGTPFSDSDAAVLRALSGQTSILLERSLLYEDVAAGAILEERSRLAREIHDGLAQHLAFLKMRVAWLQKSSESVEIKQLRDIEGVLTTALTEARQAISTLRVDSGATTTAEAIIGYLEEFSKISDLNLRVKQDENLPEVAPKARLELLRIVQESLNNVRKHAGATEVGVTITSRDGNFVIRVMDNGKGFRANHTADGHFGVAIMRERAESVGGTLLVNSLPGKGTSITVAVPVPVVDQLSG